MKNIVVYPAIITLSLVGCFASEAMGQQSSREDFKEFCDAFQGRWVGKVTWVADWPGLGKRGETVTAYIEARYIEDGQGMLLKFFGGNGSATLLTAYDARAKQIKSMWVGSGGGVTHTVIQKQNGKWVEKGTGSLVDGRKGLADLLLDRPRGDPVLPIVLLLELPAAFRLLDRPLHRLGDAVRVQDHLAAQIARRPPAGLDQRALASKETLLVGVQDPHERHLGEVESLTEEIDPDQDVEDPLPKVA